MSISTPTPSPAPRLTMTSAADPEDAGPTSLAPDPGRVSRIRQNWAVREDSALAQRLQMQEIETHLGENRSRNHQIREDYPQAVEEQTKEADLAEMRWRARLMKQKEIEERDNKLAWKMTKELEQQNDRQYESTRDEIFARRIQNLEQQHRRTPVATRPEPEGTPPLPVLANGDVPEASGGGHVREVSFHDLRGGIRYNDDQYLVKTARPALIKAEPLYANNKPEHYAVSNPYPSEGAVGGAVGGKEEPSQLSPELMAAAGLSQKDLVLSKRAEAQLEQEKRDMELARRLQEQLSEEGGDDEVARQARDLEYAKHLQAKEKAKLKRAKERARLKKLEQQERQLQEQQEQLEATMESFNEGAARAESRTSSRQSRRSDGNHPEAEMVPPARKPYMNRAAIDTHVSSSQSDESGEPQYENVIRKKQRSPPPVPHSPGATAANVLNEDMPVPPYMPMQQSKKSSSMERKLNKKKEKEGCKQQ